MGRFWPLFLFVPLLVLSFYRSPLLTPAPSSDVLWGLVFPWVGLSFGRLIIADVNGNIVKPLPPLLLCFMCALGDSSYTIFLIHHPCFLIAFWINYLVNPYIASDDIPSQIIQVVTSIAVMIPMAELIFRYVELPMIRVGKRVI